MNAFITNSAIFFIISEGKVVYVFLFCCCFLPLLPNGLHCCLVVYVADECFLVINVADECFLVIYVADEYCCLVVYVADECFQVINVADECFL
jgi:hypothetical protein